jgi:hypothetical protein
LIAVIGFAVTVRFSRVNVCHLYPVPFWKSLHVRF